MKVTYNKEVDVLVIELRKGAVHESEETKPGVIIDYDAEGNVLRMEILDASTRADSPYRVEYEMVA
jgi:uncharacterized protein YuzE